MLNKCLFSRLCSMDGCILSVTICASEFSQFHSNGGQVGLGFNPLRPRQNGRLFPDDIFKLVFLNENVCISIKMLLKFVPRVPINNIPALVQIMAWRRAGDKPLSEPMMVSLPTHICVTRPHWVLILKKPLKSATLFRGFWHFVRRIFWHFLFDISGRKSI